MLHKFTCTYVSSKKYAKTKVDEGIFPPSSLSHTRENVIISIYEDLTKALRSLSFVLSEDPIYYRAVTAKIKLILAAVLAFV